MSKKLVYLMFLVIILTGLLIASTNVHRVEAPSATIYIRADGSIEPFTPLIFTADNITYSLTDSFNASIVIQRSNIIFDGNGYTIIDLINGNLVGFNLTSVNTVTIKNVNIVGFGYGIYLQSSTLNIISENNITFNEGNIYLGNSSNNTITNNTITDGAEAIQLYASSNNTISGNSMRSNYRGVWLRSNSDENLISGNNIEGNSAGISVGGSMNNVVSGNNVVSNTNGIDIVGVLFTVISGNHIAANTQYGIILDAANNNTISANNLTDNNLGIFLDGLCNNNTVYYNHFINNTQQVVVSLGDVNTWDNGYPSGGNYWTDYSVSDWSSGPYQNETGSDGIGDSEHVLDANNTDHFPLMGMFSDFNATSGHHVQTVCNSTVSDFHLGIIVWWGGGYSRTINFNVTGEDGTSGFCRICIPTALMNETYSVFVNGTVVPYTLLACSNNTNSYLYFTYNHSTQEVIIIPEFQSFIILSLFMIATLLAAMIHRRKHTG
ncbi:right-handed parallel beta-helix repeat-containing protein [Candidatus Bathyarchaeota archaeon]|nr:right-handed parallel beta-helix repeat-containing protein [Candidatus Bathyarchaeota archaeon]